MTSTDTEDLVDFIASQVAIAQHGERVITINGNVVNAVPEVAMMKIMGSTRRAAMELLAHLNAAWSISLLNWRYH